ncbi:universal stress protein [Paracoccus laeviglucosivorans]|uniref:Nucleotide-binding universal stress protein, UspA family n=1 Tax=Paracoccus laeviglucosivorans TaxID=1197861 RepID=A0A521BRI7_9RHOB|nr:universal stress protein [Paracoccus laeviglucosivorans]SMO49675.1 Nucleotide-binding universal stress protein, UspA family [Paracoccus laeviglucosivorans]
MRRYLVASDLSARSAQAVARGVQLALASHDAELTLLHVTDDAGPDRPEACDLLRAQLPKGAPPGIRCIANPGDPDEVILRVAEELGVDLVVMGIPRARRFPQALAGTTAERVLSAIRKPVAVIRRDADRPWNRVMLAAEEDAATVAVIAGGTALGLWQGADLTVLHATNLPAPSGLRTAGLSSVDLQRIDMLAMGELEHRLRRRFSARLTDAAHLDFAMRHGAAAQAILDQQKQDHFDLVVMGSHGQGTLSRLICGSTSAEIIRDLDTDLICLPEP